MVTSTIGSPQEAAALAARLIAISRGFKNRREPMDADAAILYQVGTELAEAARTDGEWPHDALTKGRVLVWASSLMAVVHHVEPLIGEAEAATLGWLRRRALELQGHATGLRPTGTWAVSGEMEAPDEAPPEPATPPASEVDELADTAKIYPLKPRAEP